MDQLFLQSIPVTLSSVFYKHLANLTCYRTVKTTLTSHFLFECLLFVDMFITSASNVNLHDDMLC